MRFSVVVSIYNSYPYMPQCINSVLEQSYIDFELLIVNDGSTDKDTVDLCNHYAELDKRVRVINKKNGGVASARNTGIKEACGNYICFIDGDDYVHIDWLLSFSKLIRKNNHTDFIIGRMSTFLDGTNNINHKPFYVKNDNVANLLGEQALINILNSGRFTMGVRGAYKRELVKRNNLYFLEGTYYEDIDWTFKTLMKSSNVMSDENPYYFWRMRDNSVSTNVKLSDSIDIINVLKSIYEYEPQYTKPKEFRIAIAKLISTRFIAKYIKYTKQLEKRELKSFINLIEDSAYLIKYARDKRSIMIKVLFKFLGIKNTTLLLRKLRV